MNRVLITLNLMALVLLAPVGHAQGPASPPLRPTGFTVQAVGLPARSIGATSRSWRSRCGSPWRTTSRADSSPRC